MKRKILFLLLACLLCLSLALVACNSTEEENKAVTGIEIASEVPETIYQGEDLDYDNIRIKVNYYDGTSITRTVKELNAEVTKADTSKVGVRPYKITYRERSVTSYVQVEKRPPVMTGIEIVSTSLTGIVEGEKEYPVNTLQFYALFDDESKVAHFGSEEGVTYQLSESQTAGKAKLTVTYNGFSASADIDVHPAPEKTVESIALTDPAEKVFLYGAAADLSEIKVTLTLKDADDNTSQQEVNIIDGQSQWLTISGTPDTGTIGAGTLTVYAKKNSEVSCTVPYAVKYDLASYNMPQSYSDYWQRATGAAITGNANTEGATFTLSGTDAADNPTVVYEVGDLNGFIFRPTGSYRVGTTYTDLPRVASDFTLKVYSDAFETLVEGAASDYVTAEDGIYNFTNNAVGKYFEMTLTPDGGDYVAGADVKLEVRFTVVAGYNVYDTVGLSVFDNLNASWTDFKRNNSLEADGGKNLADADFADVQKIILHSDLTINADHFPSEYFWSKSTANYSIVSTALPDDYLKTNLEGSLRSWTGDSANDTYYVDKDDVYRNNAQKALYASDRCSISGNFMSVTVPDTNIGTGGNKLYVVADHENKGTKTMPASHWSLFQCMVKNDMTVYEDDAGFTNNVEITNVSFRGNAVYDSKHPNAQPTGLNLLDTEMKTFTMDNVIAYNFNTNVITEKANTDTAVTFKNTKMLDAYTNMLYIYKSAVTVENCVMKRAGGPIFILDDGESHQEGAPAPQVKVDDQSVLEAYITGGELWFSANTGASTLVNLIKGWNTFFADKNVSYLYSENNGKYTPAAATGDGAYFNLIALICPSAHFIDNDEDIKNTCLGSLVENYNGGYTYDMASLDSNLLPVPDVGNVKYRDVGAPFFQSGDQWAMTDMTSLTPLTEKWATKADWSDDHGDKIALYIPNTENTHTKPYFTAILGFGSL